MKILKYILVLVILSFALDQLVSIVMQQIFSGTHTGMSGGKTNNLLDNYDKIGILAIGNSRCGHHIIPNKISGDDAFNLSHNGMSLNFHTGLIDQLIRNENIKIDTILLQVELTEMIYPTEFRSKDVQHLKYYYDKNEWIRNEIASLSTFESLKYVYSSYQWNGKIMSIILNRIKTSKSIVPKDGFIESEASSRDSINVSMHYQSVIESNAGNFELIINDYVKTYLKHIKKLCDRNGIELICFSSPIYKPAPHIKAQAEKVKEHMKSQGISFYDYSLEYNKNSSFQDIWIWKDVYHMNKRGAELFTDLFRRDLSIDRNP